MAKYKVVNSTSYDADTPDAVIDALERVRVSGDRVTITYGDTETGEPCLGGSDTGYVGRRAGDMVPVHTGITRCNGSRVIGGRHILEIRYAGKKTGAVLYKHPNFRRWLWPGKNIGDK